MARYIVATRRSARHATAVLSAGVPFSHARHPVNCEVTELLGRVVRSRLRPPQPRRWVGS